MKTTWFETEQFSMKCGIYIPTPTGPIYKWVPMQLSEKGRSESALACYPIMPGCKPQCQRYLRACMVVTAETRPHDSAACLWSLQVFFAKRERQYKPKRCLDAPRINSRTRCWVEEAATTKPQQRLKKQEISEEIWKQTISCFGYLLIYQIYHDSSELPSQPLRSRVRRPKNSRQPWQGVRRVAESKRGDSSSTSSALAFGCNDFRPFFAIKETTPWYAMSS